MRHTLIIIATFLWGLSAIGQSGGENFNDDFAEANLLMEEGYYNQALSLWLQLSQEDPSNANLNYKVGYCYLKSSNDKKKDVKPKPKTKDGSRRALLSRSTSTLDAPPNSR